MSRRPVSLGAPSREEILRHVEQAEGEVTRRDLARAFKVKGPARAELRERLRELEDEGVLTRAKGRRMRPAGELPEVTVLDITSGDSDGYYYARARRADDADDSPVIEIPPSGYRGRAPDIGDRVLARLKRLGGQRYEASIMRILPRHRGEVVGVLEWRGRSFRLHPIERGAKTEFHIGEQDVGGAGDGDIVLAEIAEEHRQGLPKARVIERIGDADDPRTISLMSAHAEGIRLTFPPEVVAEAEACTPVELGKRTDLRDVPLVTIDGADARDFDDAVFAEPDPDGANPGGFRLVVAIADVAHYVRPDSALDREARLRGNSVYFPDRVIPMLPEALSNGLCSLRPDEERACLAVDMVIDADGNKRRHRFMRGLMRSRARLTYEQAQAAADGDDHAVDHALLEPVIKPLNAAYRALLSARARRGTLELDMPERVVVLDDAGKPTQIEPRQRLDSHRLIEEFMILANVAAAEALEANKGLCMYRVHDRPDAARLEGLGFLLESLGMRGAIRNLRKPADFTGLLGKIDDPGLRELVSMSVLRSQAQAVYQPENIGHFGLALHKYAHFTSPIRRYADLLVHRALIRFLDLPGDGALPDPLDEDRFADTGQHISRTERQAQAAERRAHDRYLSLFLADRIGSTFDGVVTSVQRFGLFVQLKDTGADGLVPIGSLGREYFEHDDRRQMLIGAETGQIFGIGDQVVVELVEADALSGSISLRLRDHKPGPSALAAMRDGPGQTGRRNGGRRPGARPARPTKKPKPAKRRS